jgi:predicted metallopeptidase
LPQALVRRPEQHIRAGVLGLQLDHPFQADNRLVVTAGHVARISERIEVVPEVWAEQHRVLQLSRGFVVGALLDEQEPERPMRLVTVRH